MTKVGKRGAELAGEMHRGVTLSGSTPGDARRQSAGVGRRASGGGWYGDALRARQGLSLLSCVPREAVGPGISPELECRKEADHDGCLDY